MHAEGDMAHNTQDLETSSIGIYIYIYIYIYIMMMSSHKRTGKNIYNQSINNFECHLQGYVQIEKITKATCVFILHSIKAVDLDKL